MNKYRMQGLATAVVGLSLIGLGILFLAGNVFHLDVWGFIWPFFIIVPGLFFFAGMFALGKNGAPLAIPGSIVTTVGMILLCQVITGHWASWAYAWALVFPTSVGIGLAITGLWSDEPKTVRTGTVMAGIGLIVFLFFAVFFELLLNISGLRSGLFGRLLFPLIIIGAGVVVLILAVLPRQHGESGGE